MTFNEKIDKFIVENNIPNLKQFALQAGIPYTTLKDFYDKQSADNSRMSTIRKLSKYMHCSMDYLAYDDITDKNEILLNGLDIDDPYTDKDREYNVNIEVGVPESKTNLLFDYLKDNKVKYKILDVQGNPDELDVLFDKHKDILTEDDKETIKFIIEKRKREIDKELDGE